MSDHTTDCARFEDWLLAGPESLDPSPWQSHLDCCSECRAQWAAHQTLVAAFAEERVPELSPAFEAGLERKLAAAAIEVRPLRGWRVAALAAYALLAVVAMGWVLTRYPLPSIDLSKPWVGVVALVAAPLTFWLAAAATRLLPTSRPRGLNLLSL